MLLAAFHVKHFCKSHRLCHLSPQDLGLIVWISYEYGTAVVTCCPHPIISFSKCVHVGRNLSLSFFLFMHLFMKLVSNCWVRKMGFGDSNKSTWFQKKHVWATLCLSGFVSFVPFLSPTFLWLSPSLRFNYPFLFLTP